MKKIKTVVINGEFYDHKVTGVQRYAMEIIQKLDEIYGEKPDDMKLELLVPSDMVNTPKLNSIKIIKYKKHKKLLWSQWHLYRYCKKNNAICLCLHSFTPLLYSRNSVDVVHDCATLAHPEFYSKKTLLMFKIFLWSRIKKIKHIITVSHFSEDEIIKYCSIDERNITIAYNSCEHMDAVNPDEGIFDKYPIIKEKKYCYTLSSLSPNKNLKWILEVAKNNPEYYFVVSGAKFKMFSEYNNETLDNVIYTDYVSDEEAKALMEHCTLYLFPTLYEGFGITPMESLQADAEIVISDTPCMREIYGDIAVYVNPYRYDYNIDKLIHTTSKAKKQALLNKYSWRKSAEKIWKLFEI